MKKIIFLLLIITIAIFINRKDSPFLNKSLNQKPPSTPISTTSPSELTLINKLDTITHQDAIYPFTYFTVDKPENLKLFSNLSQMDSSLEIIKKNDCSFLVNGGFYDKNNQPLGWFVKDGQELSKEITSNLFNGFIQKNDTKISITTSPLKNVDFGLQSGPLLIQGGETITLKIINDESRRRVIAALNTQNKLTFISIISKDSEFNGPLLAETPQVLEKIAKKINQSFDFAINLDGGSASAFYTKDIHIKEFSHIGSYFCLKI